MTEISARKFDRCANNELKECIVRHMTKFEQCVGGVRVKSFRTPHDSMMSVGYRLEFEGEDGKICSVGIATDMGCVTRDVCEGLFGCETVVIESNHDAEMLRDGPYPPYLKERVASERGHLSNGQSAELTAHLAKAGTKTIILAHLSEENNDPQIALNEHLRAICDPRVTLVAACQNAPVIIEMGGGNTTGKETKVAFG